MLSIKQIISKSIKAIIWSFGFFFPVDKKKILCASFEGKGYSDNPKYIVEELRKSGNYKIVWLVAKKEIPNHLPDDVISCESESLSAIYHMLTSSVWIDNCRKKFRYKKRKTLYIQTWHGGGGGKKCEQDTIETLNKDYKKRAIKDAKNTDIMVASDKFAKKLYHNSFWYDGAVAEIGYPRYIPFWSCKKDSIRKNVYDFFNIPFDREIVLYAPTFRNNNIDFLYNIDLMCVLDAISERFRKKFVIVTHMHINIKTDRSPFKFDGVNIIEGNTYPDMQELLAASEIMISDYSSVAYDFALMKKPVFRYLPDLKAYKADRDMYFKIDEYPYPYAENNDELEMIIRNFDYQKYLSDLNVFFDAVGAIHNENAAKRVAEYIEEYTTNGLDKKRLFEKFAPDFN